MRRSLEGILFFAVVLTAGWLGGPLVIADGSPLRARNGSDPGGTCADSTTLLDCQTDPNTGLSCGTKYTGVVSGNLYWFNQVGNTCNNTFSCGSSPYYSSTPGTCVPNNGGGGA